MTDSSNGHATVTVVVDDTDPRDPTARCDRCGALGTIAQAKLHTEPPTVWRYCGACWPEAQAALEAQRAAEKAEWHAAYRLWARDFHRNPRGAPPQPKPPPSFSSSSRSWHDIRRFLQRFTPAAAPNPPSADLARVAKDIRARESEMDGPMPPDIAAFVDRFDPPATR